ncbi:MAG TPA: DNA polymerase III subunit beta [Ignavibacteriales bacterium]|nr:DNA polymerase III subunit beta [Ignavibacteriales bacterium]HOL80321.1 DNA polymerase III subunit beta [Ignavibacteriales bacterium]HOM64600.1 DNA polymerase III subunit beta [Ignavibacteriales bacterium]HPD66697.1 DNA polymerase III subunit beta [Ignavibacteriales bacterium]HPP32510.1 DNA polymerase III subunit beta [Ignavibacteriales bacterium]
MEFEVKSSVFNEILSNVIPAIPTKTTQPILTNFLFEITDGVLNVSATNGDMTIRSKTDIFSTENISFCLPAKLLYETIKNVLSTENLKFVFKENHKLIIHAGRGEYKFTYIDANEYPKIPIAIDESFTEINGLLLKTFIQKTSFAVASEDDTRVAMTGILFDFDNNKLKVVATNGHLLGKYEKDLENIDFSSQYIVPAKATDALLKVLTDKTVKIIFQHGSIKFLMGNYELTTRIINAKYPDYNTVIPKETKYEMIINSGQLRTAIKRLLVYATGETKKIVLTLGDNKIIIKAYNELNAAEGVEEIDCQYSDTPFDISFNGGNLEKVLSQFDGEDIVFKMNSPDRTVLIKSTNEVEGEDFLILTVPLRINK